MTRAGRLATTSLVFALIQGGCRIPNEDHCGRRRGDLTCLELDPSRPHCSLCEADHDGCVESIAQIPMQCRPTGSEIADETETESESDTGPESESESDTDTESTETGTSPECGNGVKDPGEDCDGTDFGDATCADPYQLPAGNLVCVPGECVIVTSQCCLADGELCQRGECCNANCNLVTNKCGL
ncbi:MAG: hypothetical protein R6X02_05245 [Enhygromyxa sp.]